MKRKLFVSFLLLSVVICVMYFIHESYARAQVYSILKTTYYSFVSAIIDDDKSVYGALDSVVQALGPQADRLVYLHYPEVSFDQNDIIFILKKNSWRDRSGLLKKSGEILLSTETSKQNFDSERLEGAKMIDRNTWPLLRTLEDTTGFERGFFKKSDE